MSPGLEIGVAVEPKESRSTGYELVLVVVMFNRLLSCHEPYLERTLNEVLVLAHPYVPQPE